jgi:hypothetical protein
MIQSSKPSLSFSILILVLLIAVIFVPGLHLVLKLILFLGFFYWIDRYFVELVSNEKGLIVNKGFLFKTKKNIDIEDIKKITISTFNSKWGCGFTMIFNTNKGKITFVKTSSVEEINNDINAIEIFLENVKIAYTIDEL